MLVHESPPPATRVLSAERQPFNTFPSHRFSEAECLSQSQQSMLTDRDAAVSRINVHYSTDKKDSPRYYCVAYSPSTGRRRVLLTGGIV